MLIVNECLAIIALNAMAKSAKLWLIPRGHLCMPMRRKCTRHCHAKAAGFGVTAFKKVCIPRPAAASFEASTGFCKTNAHCLLRMKAYHTASAGRLCLESTSEPAAAAAACYIVITASLLQAIRCGRLGRQRHEIAILALQWCICNCGN